MRIVVVITARASYAKLKTVIAALVARSVDVHLVAAASAVLERYGDVSRVLAADFPQCPLTKVYSVLEGETLLTSAKETGGLLSDLADLFARLSPVDGVVVMADRHEVLAVAQAAAYQHVRLIHCQGGERSGSVDDKVRDAVTQLADVHCVATKRAVMRVYGLTGDLESVHWTGCPSIDLAQQALNESPVTAEELGGAGAPIDLTKPFVVVLQHPVTSEADHAGIQMCSTLIACRDLLHFPTLVLWPGEDAGASAISKAIRGTLNIHTVRNLPPSRFLRLLTQSACLIGNSSSGIRESAYLGVPVVNIGTRQHGRERGPNVVDVDSDALRIANAIEQQIAHGPYRSSTVYGSGNSGEKIAEVICQAARSRLSQPA